MSTYIICHSGVKNMKWGIRRYQNEDGSLTELGKKHYGVGNGAKRNPKVNEYRDRLKDKKGISSMSAEQIKAANERMELEIKYRKNLEAQAAYIDKLNEANKSKFSKLMSSGMKALKKGIAEQADKEVKNFGSNLVKNMLHGKKKNGDEKSDDEKSDAGNDDNSKSKRKPASKEDIDKFYEKMSDRLDREAFDSEDRQRIFYEEFAKWQEDMAKK